MVPRRCKGVANILQVLESYQIGLDCKKALERIAEYKVATNACYNTVREVILCNISLISIFHILSVISFPNACFAWANLKVLALCKPKAAFFS